MKKYILFSLIGLFFVLGSPKTVSAIYNPISEAPNNKYGVHILNEGDIDNAGSLVNSNGGEWGYVTLVIREDERDIRRWQRFFDELRRKKLIPIVRIATKSDGKNWIKLNKEDINNWTFFLNSLNWVTDNRYVIIGNEPNHAKEWGGNINPEEYKDILCDFSKNLKEASSEFFVLPAGFDAAAPNGKDTMDEKTYLEKMIPNGNLEACIDGWTSHSYPNPNFSGSENDTGKMSIKGYEWELNFLKEKGINKELPVFITETGWKHNGNKKKSEYIEPYLLGEKYKKAYENVWNDRRIVAVTPFVLSYKEEAFANFSWMDENNAPYPFYESVKALPKQKGDPIIQDKGNINLAVIPKVVTFDSTATVLVVIQNEGKSIWNNDIDAVVEEDEKETQITRLNLLVEPGFTSVNSFKIYVKTNKEQTRGKIRLYRKGVEISNPYPFEIVVLKPVNSASNITHDIRNIFQYFVVEKIRKVNFKLIFDKI